MANQPAKEGRKKAVIKKTDNERPRRELRSPKTNLIWSVVIALALFLLTSDQRYALSAGIFAFLFFNTFDYMVFYHRYKKGEL